MSNITIAGNAAGTATFTVAAPNTSTDRTLTLPDATTTLVGTDTTQTLTNKTIDASQLTGDVPAARITTALNASGSAPIYACRAWVNFNGTGTVAIRASGNVSSITDNGTGNYTINFTTNMPDANYAVVGMSDNINANATPTVVQLVSTTAAAATVTTPAGGSKTVFSDQAIVSVAIFR